MNDTFLEAIQEWQDDEERKEVLRAQESEKWFWPEEEYVWPEEEVGKQKQAAGDDEVQQDDIVLGSPYPSMGAVALACFAYAAAVATTLALANYVLEFDIVRFMTPGQ